MDHTSSAVLQDGALVLENFTESDPVVIGVVAGADDVAAAVHTCMQVGARAIVASRGSLEEVIVQRTVDQAGERIDTATRAGAALIGAMFDPDSKSSVLSLLEEVLTVAATKVDSERWAQLNPDDERSALGRMRAAQSKELGDQHKEVQERIGEVLTLVRELQMAHAVDDAQAETFSLTTLKGMVYEDIVHLALSEACAPHADVVEDVSRTTGATGAKVGDLVVHLNPEENAGLPARTVIEAKTKRMSLRKTLDELDVALANREATAAVAVFSASDCAPIPSLFVPYGNKAIVVLDSEEPNMALVEVAMVWARFVARRGGSAEVGAFDHGRFSEALGRIVRAIECVSTIRRNNSGARRNLDQAGAELDYLEAEVRSGILELKEIVAGLR
jgi:hypothetical protein